ncbi:MAG: flavodoxin [Oscillospiraceae bacterium]|nr:flavodoxin [Oscillospiraceae bacterium]
MSKIAVVYWSGTGNTQSMAEAVAEGAREAGADVTVFTSSEFDGGKMGEFDAVAFGCPAMGSEVLEESEFEPMFNGCESALSGKKIALFGSYGWGDGEWMRNWEETCKADGAVLACESVTCNDAPDDDAVVACKALGAALN